MKNEAKLDIIISLLSRMAYGAGEIKKQVTKSKKNPKQWIQGYNSCTGSNTVTQIAKAAGVKPPTATVILKSWLDAGLVYNIGTESKPLYKNLMNLVK